MTTTPLTAIGLARQPGGSAGTSVQAIGYGMLDPIASHRGGRNCCSEWNSRPLHTEDFNHPWALYPDSA